MWGVSAARFLAHGARLEACVAFACCLTAAVLLAASLYQRCCYARFMPHTTVAALLQAHGAAAFVCVTGVHMLAGRCGCCLAWRLLRFGRCRGWLLWRSSAGTAAAHDLLRLPWICTLATPCLCMPCRAFQPMLSPPTPCSFAATAATCFASASSVWCTTPASSRQAAVPGLQAWQRVSSGCCVSALVHAIVCRACVLASSACSAASLQTLNKFRPSRA